VRTVRALVTGCAGFIGSHLVDSLLADDAEVDGVDCFTDNYGRTEKLRNLSHAQDRNAFSFSELDLAEADVSDLVDKADVVFHLAAEPGVRSSWGSRFDVYSRNNVLATQRLLEALKALPQKRFVFASSSSVYGEAERLPTAESTMPRPISPYGVTKLAAEHLVRLYAANFGIDGISLRYFSVYGPRQRPDMAFHRFFNAAIAGSPVTVFGDGHQVRDFTYISDVVDATKAAAASSTSEEVINVGAASQVTVARVLELIGDVAGNSLNIQHSPPQRGDVRATGADITKAREQLGYKAQVAVEDGIRFQFEWILETRRSKLVGTTA
jgi:UDP-glucuronate 4-epimerase